MKKSSTILISTFLISFILISCASSELAVKKPLETKLNQYPNFVFYAESAVTEDVQEHITDLEAEVMKRVKELNLFERTELGDSTTSNEKSLVVKAIITDITTVTGLERFLIGAFAGKASMTIDISFIDGETGNIIGEYTIKGESGSTGYSGGTGEAIEMTADKISEVITENYE